MTHPAATLAASTLAAATRAPALLAVALALGALLTGCAREPAPPAATAPSPYAAVARGRVDVEGGLLDLAAPLEGRVARLRVQEGQRVHQGDALLELDDTAARLDVAAASAGLGEAAAQLRALDTQAAAAAARAQRLRAAEQAGAAEGQAADDAEAQARQLAAQRDVLGAQRAAAEAKLAMARHALGLHVLAAPRDALVTQVAAQAGAQVAPGSGTLFVLLPDTGHIVRAELSEAYVDAVQPGMTATVSPEDDPRRSWPAQVLRVGATVGPARLEEDAQRRSVERTIECVLSLDAAAPLRIGQRVLVRIGTNAAPARAAAPAPKG